MQNYQIVVELCMLRYGPLLIGEYLCHNIYIQQIFIDRINVAFLTLCNLASLLLLSLMLTHCLLLLLLLMLRLMLTRCLLLLYAAQLDSRELLWFSDTGEDAERIVEYS